MRQTGYYFVKVGRDSTRIVYTDGEQCQFLGDELLYPVEDIRFISQTPITPEKMAAIEEIVACRDGKYTLDSMVNDILDKYKLI